MEKIKVYDGKSGDVTVELTDLFWMPGVRFHAPADFSRCFHISDKESAKKLRKMLKPLARS